MTSARHCFQAALDRFGEGNFAQAMRCCKRGLSRAPDCGRLWEMAGIIFWSLDKRRRAIAALERATTLAPLGALGQCTLADAYALQGKRTLARTIYAFLAEPGRCPVDFLPRLATGLGRLGDNRLALAVCEELIKRQPSHHAAWFGVAYYRRRLGCPADQVLAPLEMAYLIAPACLTYRINLACLLLQQGNLPAARGLLQGISPDQVHCPRARAILEPAFEAARD